MKNLLIILSICFSSVTYSQTDVDYIIKGKTQYDLQNYTGAIEDYFKALEINPKNKEAYFYIGIAQWHLEDFKGAIQNYNQALVFDTMFYEAYYYRGLAESENKDFKSAIKDYSKVIKINQKDPEVFCNRALSNWQMRYYSNAISDFTKAIEINPSYSEAYYYRAGAKKESKDVKGAIHDFSKAIELDHNFIGRYEYDYLFFDDKFDSMDYQHQIQMSNIFIKIYPNKALPYEIRGRIKARKKKYSDAMKDFNMAVKIETKFSETYYYRGLITYYFLKNTTKACEDWNTAVKLGNFDAEDEIKKNCK